MELCVASNFYEDKKLSIRIERDIKQHTKVQKNQVVQKQLSFTEINFAKLFNMSQTVSPGNKWNLQAALKCSTEKWLLIRF